jgi:Mn2+/Fe2+ NRAMP family transporter
MAIAIGAETVPNKNWNSKSRYSIVLALLCCSALLVIQAVLSSFTRFMDMTSVIVFLIGPFLALLNHKAIFSNEVEKDNQPGVIIRAWSIISIISLFALMAVYIYSRLV